MSQERDTHIQRQIPRAGDKAQIDYMLLQSEGYTCCWTDRAEHSSRFTWTEANLFCIAVELNAPSDDPSLKTYYFPVRAR